MRDPKQIEAARLSYIADLEAKRDAATWPSQRQQFAALIESAQRNGADVVPPYQPWRTRIKADAESNPAWDALPRAPRHLPCDCQPTVEGDHLPRCASWSLEGEGVTP